MVTSPAFNPFALIVDPAAVFRAVESSSTLGGLHTRVFRPLERHEGRDGDDAELAAYDAEVEAFGADDGVVGALLEDGDLVANQVD